LYLYFSSRQKMAERSSWLRPEKSSYVDSGLAEDRPERSLSHIACVMRDGDFSSTLRVAPDLVATRSLAIKLEAKRAQAANNLAIGKPR
jgi:hypothetical protein